jgi:hypothetical protein
MNNKLAKKIRKHVKETMSDSAKWELYDTKVVTRPTILDATGKIGESVTHVKSLVKGTGKQRYREIKNLYKKRATRGVQ